MNEIICLCVRLCMYVWMYEGVHACMRPIGRHEPCVCPSIEDHMDNFSVPVIACVVQRCSAVLPRGRKQETLRLSSEKFKNRKPMHGMQEISQCCLYGVFGVVLLQLGFIPDLVSYIHVHATIQNALHFRKIPFFNLSREVIPSVRSFSGLNKMP